MKTLFAVLLLVFGFNFAADAQRPGPVPGQPWLHPSINGDFSVSIFNGKPTLRFSWSVVNLGTADWIGPMRDQDRYFTNLTTFPYFRGVLKNACYFSLHDEFTGEAVYDSRIAEAPIYWDFFGVPGGPKYGGNPTMTGISPFCAAVSLGPYTFFPFDEIPKGTWRMQFWFDPLNEFGGWSWSEELVHVGANSMTRLNFVGPRPK